MANQNLEESISGFQMPEKMHGQGSISFSNYSSFSFYLPLVFLLALSAGSAGQKLFAQLKENANPLQSANPVQSHSSQSDSTANANNKDAKKEHAQNQHSASIYGPSRPFRFELRGQRKKEEDMATNSAVALAEDEHGKMYLLQFTNQQPEDKPKLFATDHQNNLNLGARFYHVGDLLELKGVLGQQTLQNITNYGLYATLRDKLLGSQIKFRVGYEQAHPSSNDIHKLLVSSLRAKLDLGSFLQAIELNGLASKTLNGNDVNAQLGGGLTFYLPVNFYASTNVTSPKNDAEGNAYTLHVGRFASYGGEKFPTGFLVYRGNKEKGFYLAGLMIGGRQEFVKEAALGMGEGFFFGTAADPALATLRDFNNFGGAFSTDYSIADFVAFYADLNVDIPGTGLNVSARELDVYWTPPADFFRSKGFHIDAAIGSTTTPNFRKMESETDNYRLIGAGFSPARDFDVSVMKTVGRKDYRIGVRKILN